MRPLHGALPGLHTEKVLNPKEIILGLRGYLDQFGPAGETALLGRHISEEAVFQCTTCGPASFSVRWASSTCR